jgi:hypothetical protein
VHIFAINRSIVDYCKPFTLLRRISILLKSTKIAYCIIRVRLRVQMIKVNKQHISLLTFFASCVLSTVCQSDYLVNKLTLLLAPNPGILSLYHSRIPFCNDPFNFNIFKRRCFFQSRNKVH